MIRATVIFPFVLLALFLERPLQPAFAQTSTSGSSSKSDTKSPGAPEKTKKSTLGGAPGSKNAIVFTDVHTGMFEIPLSKLTPNGIVELKCINGIHVLSIPIPERWEVIEAKIRVRFSPSPNLLADVSRLVLKLNGFPIGQTKLNPAKPLQDFEVSAPAHMFESGYNSLAFEVFQHYSRNECEFPCAPDLWTAINMNESVLSIKYKIKPLPLKLSIFAKYLFDPKAYPYGRVNIIMKDTEEQTIKAAAVVSSGIARRFDYNKVVFSVSRDVVPKVDNVLIGDKEFVTEFLKEHGIEIEEITAGFIQIMHLPIDKNTHNPNFGLMVVSGRTFHEVKIAAETLAHISFAYPGTASMTTMGFTMPEIAQYSGRLVLTADKIYDLKTLKLRTHTFHGFNAPPREITFRLPADFLIKANKIAKLSLRFAYGAGLGPTSTLNILLNRTMIRTIHLDNKHGAFIEDYVINIPTYMFKVGSNTVSFEPHMASESKLCDFVQTGNMVLTIFESSTLYFPQMQHFVALPQIELFTLNGFPFTRWPDGFETMVYISDDDPKAIAAALNILGMMTQKNGFPLFGIEVTTKYPRDWKGELLVFGTPDTLNDELTQNAPLRMHGVSVVPYPIVRSWEGETTFAYSEQISGIGDQHGLVMEFESPFEKGRTVLLFVAQGPDQLLALTEAMLVPEVQSMSEGDIVLINLTPSPKYKVTALFTGKTYNTGKAGRLSKLDYYLIAYPWLYYAAVLALFLIAGFVTFLILKRARRSSAPKTDTP